MSGRQYHVSLGILVKTGERATELVGQLALIVGQLQSSGDVENLSLSVTPLDPDEDEDEDEALETVVTLSGEPFDRRGDQ